MVLVRGQPDVDSVETANPVPIVSVTKAFRDDLLSFLQRQQNCGFLLLGGFNEALGEGKEGMLRIAGPTVAQ